jgi:hypothetical protein
MLTQLVKISSNAKIGKIPATNSSRLTCPDSCPFKLNGCYADAGFHTRLNWDKVTSGARGLEWSDFLASIKAIKPATLWRHNVSGDLRPTAYNSELIDSNALTELATANSDSRGFTYTHYKPSKHNIAAIRKANKLGFTVNLSANSVSQSIEYKKAFPDLPVVTVAPSDIDIETRTIDGVKVIICPATYKDNVTCKTCKLCSIANRDSVVAFPAHGTQTKKADIIARG